jgi:hypothetical protein
MSPSAAIRWGGGLTSVAAGILLLLGHVINLGGDPEYGTVLGETLVLSAHALLVFSLVALWAVQAERSGPIGAAGMVLSVVGTTLNCAAVLGEIAGPQELTWIRWSRRGYRERSPCWEGLLS